MRPTVVAVVLGVGLAMLAGPRVVVTEEASGAIAGTITDIDGAPLAGVTVTVTQGDIRRQAETDESGAYRLESLAPGLYRATARLAEHIPVGHPDEAVLVWDQRARWSARLARTDRAEDVALEPHDHGILSFLERHGDGTELARTAQLEALGIHVERWLATRPGAYELEIRLRPVSGRLRGVRLQVEGRTATPVDARSARAAEVARLFGSVEQLFETVLAVIEHRSSRLTIVYDTEFGYPKDIDADPDRLVKDEELQLAVAGFRPIRQ